MVGRFVKHMFPLFMYIVYVFPFPLVSLCVCLSEWEPMDGSHSFCPECDGQR